MKRWDARLDWLRAAALVFILLHHSDDYAVPFLRTTPTLARIDDILLTWVPLATFFTISGYLAGTTRNAGAREHLVRRFSRLYVPYAVALVLLWVLGVFDLGVRQVLLNLALLGPWAGVPVGTLWFVEVLLFYQLTYGGWLALGRKRWPLWSLPAFFAAVTLLLAGGSAAFGWAPDARPVVYLAAFTGGACLTLPVDPAVGAVRARSIALGAAAVLPLLLAAVPLWREPMWDALLWSTVTAAAVTAALASWPKPTASPRVVHAVAVGSFMAYLLHRFAFHWAAQIGSSWGDRGVTAAVLLAIPVVLIAGVYGQRLVDRFQRS